MNFVFLLLDFYFFFLFENWNHLYRLTGKTSLISMLIMFKKIFVFIFLLFKQNMKNIFIEFFFFKFLMHLTSWFVFLVISRWIYFFISVRRIYFAILTSKCFAKTKKTKKIILFTYFIGCWLAELIWPFVGNRFFFLVFSWKNKFLNLKKDQNRLLAPFNATWNVLWMIQNKKKKYWRTKIRISRTVENICFVLRFVWLTHASQ